MARALPLFQHYNVAIKNTNAFNIPFKADFDVTRNVDVLSNPSDYTLAIERFSVPTRYIPIFIFEDGNYTVTIKTGAGDFANTVVYVLEANLAIPPLFSRAVNTYQSFVNMVNTSLLAASVAAGLADPPFITYDAKEDNLFCLFVPTAYVGAGATIFFNSNLFLKFFYSFDAFHNSNPIATDNYLIRFSDLNGLNTVAIGGVDHFKMTQDFSVVSTWSDFQSLVFETSSIAVNPEMLATQNNGTRVILTDFEPELTANNRSVIQYFSSGYLRRYGLNSVYPLKSIRIAVLWQDNNGRLFPLFIPKETVLTMKILFERIDTVITSGNDGIRQAAGKLTERY